MKMKSAEIRKIIRLWELLDDFNKDEIDIFRLFPLPKSCFFPMSGRSKKQKKDDKKRNLIEKVGKKTGRSKETNGKRTS